MGHQLRDNHHLMRCQIKQTRNVFTTEFKQDCARLIVEQGYGVRPASKAMNVGFQRYSACSGSIEMKCKASRYNHSITAAYSGAGS
jgi:hypothetical protein